MYCTYKQKAVGSPEEQVTNPAWESWGRLFSFPHNFSQIDLKSQGALKADLFPLPTKDILRRHEESCSGETETLATAPEQKELIGLLGTGRAMCGSSINGTGRNLGFNLPTRALQF